MTCAGRLQPQRAAPDRQWSHLRPNTGSNGSFRVEGGPCTDAIHFCQRIPPQ
jgi:hypothetical protein